MIENDLIELLKWLETECRDTRRLKGPRFEGQTMPFEDLTPERRLRWISALDGASCELTRMSRCLKVGYRTQINDKLLEKLDMDNW